MRPGLIPFIWLFGMLIASCAPAPPQQESLAAATPQVTAVELASTEPPTPTVRPTSTPELTVLLPETPTPTALPTSTPTPTGTPTPKPLPTRPPNTATSPPPMLTSTWTPESTKRPPTATLVSPTATQEAVHPVLAWTAPNPPIYDNQLSWDSPGYTVLKDNGGAKGEIIDWQGGAIKYTVVENRSEGDDVRYYPDKEGPHIDKPVEWSMSFELMFGEGYLPDQEGEGISIGSAFYHIKPLEGHYNVMAGVDVFVARKPVISVFDPETGERVAKYKSSSFTVSPNVPYDFRLYTNTGHIYVAFNGQVVAYGPLPKYYQGVAPVEFHAGAYGHGSGVGSYILNSPFSLTFNEIK
jgi:hypothetical protein